MPGSRTKQHLCGAAHGAGGIGWSLLELHNATGAGRFCVGAEGAFAYERSWLNLNSGTWPDLRIAGQRRGAAREITSSMTGTWCHGEAGIAVTRVRATAVLGPGPHCDDVEIALETTRRHLAGLQPYEIEDLSLCHGAAGAADALLLAAHALGGQWRPAADIAADFGRVVLERRVAAEADWPCGTPGTTPDLFLGLSGIGWLFLRLHDPTIQSPLLLPMHG
jgi:lantibiotic modifying enzyme